jgi:hypothetical protein
MKRIFLLALCFCLVAGTAVAAQPSYLSDLPKSHWAYEAVALLAKEGIIDGYPDKTFQGDKAMTRYEMAQVVVKAMANEKKANIAQRALIEKLASEFALDITRSRPASTRWRRSRSGSSSPASCPSSTRSRRRAS